MYGRILSLWFRPGDTQAHGWTGASIGGDAIPVIDIGIPQSGLCPENRWHHKDFAHGPCRPMSLKT